MPLNQHFENIQKITSVIMDRFGNPFVLDTIDTSEEPEPLSNIATGVVSSPEITDYLLNAKETGKEAMLNYVDDRISKGSTPLHVPIHKLKLKTFANTQFKNTKAKAKISSLKSDRDLFAKLMVISKERSVDLEHLFQYELSSIPLAIAEEDGSLAKTNKAQTLRDIEGKT